MESVILTVSDLTKIVGTAEPLSATLFDTYGNPVSGETVKFTINNVNYNRTVQDNGRVSLNINLPIGTYQCTVTFEGGSGYSGASKTVTVTVTPKKNVVLLVNNFVKTWGEAKALTAEIYEADTTPIPYKDLKFTINGVTYTRTSNSDGVASLNINLPKGNYRCVIDSPEDTTHQSYQANCNVKVMANTFMDGTDITKMEDETVVYQCAVYDPWERIEADVVITVNGVPYARHTDADGLAKLNIKLPAGEYDLRAEFQGDEFHHGSSVTNHISSKRYAQELSSLRNGVLYPGDNTGFVESHVMVKQWSPEVAKARSVLLWDDPDMSLHRDIRFTSYEITETDPRVKTAKFTSPEYFDLTGGPCWCYISSPYHENFGGRILKVDFDKDKGLYTYQCQDGRRNYMNKVRVITNNQSEAKVYDYLRSLLMSPIFPNYPNNITSEDMDKYVNHKILSGLRPIDAYELEQKSAVATIKAQNMYKDKPGETLSYDSVMDKIMNLAHFQGTPVDVYFTPEGICQIEPVNFDVWVKTGFKITHTDLVQYKYGFDTTNILTGVNVQTPDTQFVLKQSNGKEFYETTEELSYFFGGNIGMISPVTKQVESTENTDGNNNSSSSSSNNNSSSGSGGFFVDMGKPHTFAVGSDNIDDANETAYINKVINALKSKGHNAYSLGVGPSVDQNHGLSSSSSGEINIFIVGGICAGTVKDYVDGLGSYYHYDGMIMMFANCTTDNWISCNALKNKNQVRAHDDGFSTGIDTSITPHQMFENHKDKIAYVAGQPNESFDSLVEKLVNGQFNCGSTGTSSKNTNTNNNGEGTSTTTVIDEVATLDKAMKEVSKSVRDLLSFEIKLPLNHPMFKEMHTNQFLWTELPKEFKLGNLSRIFYLMKSWKENRGVEYLLNRWYIEKMVVKCDSNGLFATLTLNVFPSSYSVYKDALKGYRDAYDQAYKQKTEQKNNNSSSSSSSGSVGEARLGSDSEYTGDMACATGRYHGHAGDNENFDNCAKKGYAQQGRKYFEWARQYNSPIELAKALANRFEYEGYSENEDANADVTHNNGGTIYCNCYDAARLVKCCFDACGFDCIVVTGSIYEGGHGWNAVKWNGRWYTFDLCYAYRSAGDWGGTNTLRMAHEW